MGARFDDLSKLTPSALEDLMKSAAPRPDGDHLAGSLWHGYSLAMPAPLFALFGRFGKSFHRDADGRLRGWNTRMRQGVDGWHPLVFRGKPVTYGHYEVVTEPEGTLAELYPGAVLIDYGLGGNRAWDPLGRVRDWVVQLSDDLLLGRMYLSLGGRAVPTPSYFGLARGVPLTDLVSAPVPG